MGRKCSKCQGYKEYMKITFRKLEGKATRWSSWFRHCATNRKVAGPIPMMSLEFSIDTILPDTI